MIAAGFDLRAELAGPQAVRFLRGLPKRAAAEVWAIPVGRELRLSERSAPGGVHLAGAGRLATLMPLLRFVKVLRVYGPSDGSGSSAWEVELPGMRYTLALSPQTWRGFSGEGAVLDDLSGDQVADDADLVGVLLNFSPPLELGLLAERSGLPLDRVRAALTQLGTAGRLDTTSPRPPTSTASCPTTVTTSPRSTPPDLRPDAGGQGSRPADRPRLRRGDHGRGVREVRLQAGSCTCPWWYDHRGSRRPLQHVLAARIAARELSSPEIASAPRSPAIPGDLPVTLGDEIRALIEARDVTGLGARLAVLDDAGRREVARELPGHLKLVSRARNLWEGQGDWAEPMRVAGAGSLGGAAAVAAWLNRRDLVLFPWDAPRDTEALIMVISAREPQWQADLVARLALRIRDEDSPGAPLVMTLLRRTGVTPPQHDPLVLAWLGVTPSASRSREDPLLDVLLPRIFEAQGVGRALLDERSSPLSETSWLGVLTVLSGEGRVSRGMLLDGCVSRFLRGGDAQDLRFFARLHELLEPSPAEVESRARDYLRLLPVAPGPVAELSLKHLRRLDDLDPADVTEALEGLLFRAEGGLARTGLTWLDQIVRQAPTRADELAPALATALGHGAYAVQERAVRLAVKHARHLTPPGAEALRAALATLPPDLGRRLAGAVGGEAEPEEEPEAFTPPELTAPEPPGPFPALPALVAEFENTAWFSTWQAVESWLASFARFAAEDREALRVALGRRTRHAPTVYGKDKWYEVSDWFTAMAAELVSPGAEPEGGRSGVKEVRELKNCSRSRGRSRPW